MKDYFKRELQIDDICFRIVHTKYGNHLKVVKIKDFTPQKVKLDTKVFVDSTNLVKASAEDLEIYL
ncbi:MAG: hypothetical protein M0R17_03090 [Candidatus Omnitrophica bacterium]|jgi:hypothetical protein|nr:hypothetical protein [Candidatus Omnitrophota bacterium]